MRIYVGHMSLNDPTGQQLPEEFQFTPPPPRVQQIVKALDENRRGVHRWLWKAFLAFNLVLASLVFWLSVVPRLI